MDTIETIKMLLSFLVGGGALKLLEKLVNWRSTKRTLDNNANMAEYKTMDEIVTSFTNRMSAMAMQISDINDKNLESLERVNLLSKQLNQEKKEKSSIQKNLHDAQVLLAKYKQYLDEIHVHCQCPDQDELKNMKNALET